MDRRGGRGIRAASIGRTVATRTLVLTPTLETATGPPVVAPSSIGRDRARPRRDRRRRCRCWLQGELASCRRASIDLGHPFFRFRGLQSE